MFVNTNSIQKEHYVNSKLNKQNFELNFQIPKKSDSSIIADHSIVNLIRNDQIPDSAIMSAKQSLHIVYGHTSHGSQLTSGMTGLPAFKEGLGGTEGLYDWHDGLEEGSLDIDDYGISGDLGNPDRTSWADRTRTYLENPSNADVNVVIWSWCGQVSGATETDIETYLNLMSSLESDYPNIRFVYMTGHTDGSGLEGNLHLRNEQIRDYCSANNKILYDFADIESYDPDGDYFGDKYVTDSCNYDDGEISGNWADEWCDNHPDEWYDCSSAHSHALNANLKAYAAWYLWVRLTGWSAIEAPVLSPITPNPSFTGNISLNWVGSQDADNYSIYRDFSYINGYKESLIEIGNTEETYFNDSVSIDAVYYYAVCSSNETGTSDFSNCVSVSVEFPNPTPPILELISSDPSNTGEISLNWTENPNGLHYTIYRHTSLITELNSSVTNLYQTSTPGYSEKILSQGRFYYVVTTTTVNGTSDISNCVSVLIDFSYKDLLSNKYVIGGAAVGFLALLSIGIVIIRKKKKG